MMEDELQARLAAIVTYSDDAIISKDLRGIVQSWNVAAERIFGFAAAEMIGQPLLRIIPPERIAEEPDILAKLARGERVDHFQTVRIRKDGRRVDVSVTISPIRDGSGKVVGASKIARDITEQVRWARERERLYELGKAMAGEFDVGSLVQKITDASTVISGAQFGAFYYDVVDESGSRKTLHLTSGLSAEEAERLSMPGNAAMFASTVPGNRILRCDDVTLDARYGKDIPFASMTAGRLPVRSYLAVQVVGPRNEVLGGLFLGHSDAGVFDEQAERVVAAIAGHAGVALDNARLNRELRANAERERLARAEAERAAAETRTVTERLAQQYRLFDTAFSAVPDYIFIFTLDGRFLYANNALLALWGVTASQAVGRSMEDLQYTDAVREQLLKNIRKVVETREALSDVTAYTNPAGNSGFYEYILAPVFDAAGNVVNVAGTARDITARRQAEAERQQLLESERAARTEAERASHLKDEFLATLSHELRTPLNAILGWSQLLRRSESDAATLEEGLDVIERNARVQTQLIEDLLDMSRIISGKLRLDVQRVDLSAVVEAAVDSVRPTAEVKKLQLRTLLDPNAGPVMGDPGRLQQVMWNLLTNAIKFTPKDGRIEVMLARVDSHLEITVADTGQGIKPEFLPHVFERFRQADGSTTRKHSGLGLGLAIVKNLVELHGGNVRARSAGEGQGTTFTVSLPLAVVKHDEQHRDHPAVSQGFRDCRRVSLTGVRVLVVDDEPDARELVRRLLIDCNAEVTTSESAAEGLAAMQRQRFHILLSDIGMPQTDGYEFLRQVRRLSEEKGGRTPAIALTAFARSEDRTRAMMVGYQMHLSKPVEPQELLATVASLAGRAGES